MKKIAIILAVLMLVLLGGCGKKPSVPEKENATSQSTSEESTQAKTEPEETTGAPEATPEPVPEIEDLGNRALGTAPTFGEDSEYAGHFIFRADQDIKNFKFFKVDMFFDGDKNILTGSMEKEYGSLNAIRAGEEVLIMGDTGETLPFLAVSYESESGQKYYYAIEISGEDGHPLLTPFTFSVG